MSRENHRTATRAQIKRSKTLGDNTSVRSKTGIYEAQKLRSGLHNRVGYDVRDVDVKTIRLCVHDNRRFPGNRGNRVYHQFITEFVCFKSMTEIAGNKKKKKRTVFHETQYAMFTDVLSVRYRFGLYRSTKPAHRPNINTNELISIHFDKPSSSRHVASMFPKTI